MQTNQFSNKFIVPLHGVNIVDLFLERALQTVQAIEMNTLPPTTPRSNVKRLCEHPEMAGKMSAKIISKYGKRKAFTVRKRLKL